MHVYPLFSFDQIISSVFANKSNVIEFDAPTTGKLITVNKLFVVEDK